MVYSYLLEKVSPSSSCFDEGQREEGEIIDELALSLPSFAFPFSRAAKLELPLLLEETLISSRKSLLLRLSVCRRCREDEDG